MDTPTAKNCLPAFPWWWTMIFCGVGPRRASQEKFARRMSDGAQDVSRMWPEAITWKADKGEDDQHGK